MQYNYKPSGICPRRITVDIEGDILKNVEFEGGCHGNLQAVSKLVRDMPISLIKETLSGIKCGKKPTSCPDQLTKAIDEARAAFATEAL